VGSKSGLCLVDNADISCSSCKSYPTAGDETVHGRLVQRFLRDHPKPKMPETAMRHC
jgi:hypothetical protein